MRAGRVSAHAKPDRRLTKGLTVQWSGQSFAHSCQVVEPVIVRRPMGFGLKTVARSLKKHGLIETDWSDGVTDGLGAMVAAWWCSDVARMQGCLLADVALMAEVSAYNEVDCRVMMEAVEYLRGRVR